MYFIEHVRSKKTFSKIWITQINYALQVWFKARNPLELPTVIDSFKIDRLEMCEAVCYFQLYIQLTSL